MTAVQAEGAPSLWFRAFEHGASRGKFYRDASTVAANCAFRTSGRYFGVLDALRASHGTAVAVKGAYPGRRPHPAGGPPN
jgi:hypothetical protein